MQDLTLFFIFFMTLFFTIKNIMARLPRIVIPEQPLHIIQRGNNRL